MAGLYVHIPLCRSKCAYCDFYSGPLKADPGQLVDALLNEYRHRRDEISEPITTVYIGGGTPSSLPIDSLLRLIDGLGIDRAAEYTVEANPEDVSTEWCRAIADTPVNRISMGIQSFDDRQLRLLGRRHSASDALSAVENLRSAGMAEISCDLIYGLPGQTPADWHASLTRLLDLGLPHFSSYLLSYEQGTRLWAMLQSGKVTEATEDEATDMFTMLCDEARRHGYEHYEISNFAKPGHHAIHNSSYWDGTPYLGIGPGAHSFDGTVRRSVRTNLKEYIANNGIGCFDTETESRSERFNDYIITSLRTSKGLSLARCESLFGQPMTDRLIKSARPLFASGSLLRNGDRLTIPEHHWLVSDRIFLDLIDV